MAERQREGTEMSTEETTVGDEIATTDEVNEAAYGVFSEIGIGIGNEAAFVLRDKVAEQLAGWINDGGWPFGLDVDRFADEMSDWPSGSGVISIYTHTQVLQWAEMGLWGCDVWDDFGEDAGCVDGDTIADRIGKELAHVAYRLAFAMGHTANEIIEERHDEEDG
jgi:hypothetical protein